MKPSSLHALVIDRHFGELSPEAVELLELHLAQHPEAQAEAERILQTLSVTHDTLLRHPELARVVPAQERVTAPLPVRKQIAWTTLLSRAAAVFLLAALAGTGGFIAGRSDSQTSLLAGDQGTVLSPAKAPRKESPWARYRMSFNPAGEGMQLVRVDTEDQNQKSLQ